ncbi:MAG: magnesium transporter [Anaerolineae bacterium]|jgi:magnesium transporter|nr:magnesium transporter [Anaerolineae bacterium]MDX9830146.1 magnesium transporter [Anaerolineae bacterium]
MESFALEGILDQLRSALERDDLSGAAAIIAALRPPDQAEVFAELQDREQRVLLPELHPDDSADILEELDDEQAAELVAVLSTETVIRIVDEMEPDEAADLLGDMPRDRAIAVLAGLEDPDEVRPLLLHADDSAGGLMTSDFLALRVRMTAGEALQAIREWQPDSGSVYYLFVVDRLGRLLGVVNLWQLVVANPRTPLSEIMDPEVIYVRVGVDQEECARLMVRYDLVALPVVNGDDTLVGVVTFDDVMEVLEDEATEDIQRLGGAQPLERPYLDTNVLTLARKRIGWLLLLFLTATLTGSVMRLFEDLLQSMVALAVFVPLLIGTGGNAGSQTTAILIRELATGQVELGDALRVWLHEAAVGLLLGLGMAVVAYTRAITWESDPALALTVSIAIMGIVLWATSIGSLLPLIAARLKIDPTVVSGPVMSTLVDATGLFIYFSIARLVLGL